MIDQRKLLEAIGCTVRASFYEMCNEPVADIVEPQPGLAFQVCKRHQGMVR